MKKFFLKSICLALTACLLLCGCDIRSLTGPDKETDSGISVRGEPLTIDGKSSSTDGEPSEYPVIINGITVNASPKSVICMSSGLTEMIYELGFGDRLIGRGSYCDSPENVLSLKDYGKPSAPDLDAIIAARPDIVITATSIPDKDTVLLSDSGISVLYIPAPRSVEEFGKIYCALGMIFEGMFDGEDDGNKLFTQVKMSFYSCDYSVGNFIYITEGLTAAGGDTFESSVLSLLGTNIAADASGYVSYASLSSDVQPDTVLLNSDISVEEVRADETLGTLEAVANGNIITISNSYFESPSGRLTGIIAELYGGDAEEQP